MNIRNFRKNLASALNQVVTSSEPLPVNNADKPDVDVVVVRRDMWEEAQAALAASREHKLEASA